MIIRYRFFAALTGLLLAVPAAATVVLSSAIYTQDFDTLANSGTSTVLPAG